MTNEELQLLPIFFELLTPEQKAEVRAAMDKKIRELGEENVKNILDSNL